MPSTPTAQASTLALVGTTLQTTVRYICTSPSRLVNSLLKPADGFSNIATTIALAFGTHSLYKYIFPGDSSSAISTGNSESPSLIQQFTVEVAKGGIALGKDVGSGLFTAVVDSVAPINNQPQSKPLNFDHLPKSNPFQLPQHTLKYNPNCIGNLNCQKIIDRGPASSSLALPVVFLVGTLWVAMYAYQRYVNNTTSKKTKLPKQDRIKA